MVVANFRGRFIVSIIMLSVSSWLSIGNEVDKHGRREDKQLGIYLDWMMLNPILMKNTNMCLVEKERR